MILQFINQMDTYFFILINGDLSNSFFDVLMPLVSYAGNSGLLWLFLAVLLALVRRSSFGPRGLALVVLALLSSYLLVDEFLKDVVARPRPFLVLGDVNLLIPAPQDYSFPSGHAATAFAAAAVIASLAPGSAAAVVLLAVIAAFSRVYVGVHYPLDVMGGAMVGAFTGWLFIKLAGFTFRGRYGNRSSGRWL